MNILLLSRYQFPLVKSGGTGVGVSEFMKAFNLIPGVSVKHWTWDHDNKLSSQIQDMREFRPLCNYSYDNYEGVIGSKRRYIHRLISYLFRRRQREHKLEEIKLRNLMGIMLTNLNMLSAYEDLNSFDVIHLHTWELYYTAIIAKYLFNKPLLFTTHDVMQGDKPKEVHSSDLNDHAILAERILAYECDAVVAVSEENKHHFQKLYPQSAHKCHVIPEGVNLESFKKTSTTNVFNKHNIEIEKPYIFFLGRASYQKGIDYLVNATNQIPEDIPVLFATSTHRWDGKRYEQADKYLSMVDDLMNNRENVHLIKNEWDRSLLSELYSHAALTVMPSRYETCGMVQLESQACSTPVIANACGNVTDSIEHGKTGILLKLVEDEAQYTKKLADNILQLWQKKDKLAQMGTAARSYVENNHSWHKRAIQHIALYKRLRDK